LASEMTATIDLRKTKNETQHDWLCF